MQYVTDVNWSLTEIKNAQRCVVEMVGADSSLSHAMGCLVSVAEDAVEAVRLAEEARRAAFWVAEETMNEQAAAAAARSARNAHAAAWNIIDAASMEAGRRIPGQTIEDDDQILDEMYETEMEQAWQERYNVD